MECLLRVPDRETDQRAGLAVAKPERFPEPRERASLSLSEPVHGVDQSLPRLCRWRNW